jgi:glycosyltransferase involved in cell wall biosynthesis
MSTKCIDIVLASYNGADYIKEQLDSIMSCEGYNELVNEIIISDDCSIDDTVKIINEINDTKIKLLKINFKKACG